MVFVMLRLKSPALLIVVHMNGKKLGPAQEYTNPVFMALGELELLATVYQEETGMYLIPVIVQLL